MLDLTLLSLEELSELQTKIVAERTAREAKGKGFDCEYFLNNRKSGNPSTYKQIQYAESLAKNTYSIISPTTSMMMKYLDASDMSEAIDMMKKGKRISIS